MKLILEGLFRPFELFMGAPLFAFLIAGLLWGLFFFGVARRKKRVPLANWAVLFPASTWALYAIYETWISGKGYSIRVDLLFIAPVLWVSLIAGLVPWFVGLRRSRVSEDKQERSTKPLRVSRGIAFLGWVVAIWGALGVLYGIFYLDLTLRVLHDMSEFRWTSASFWGQWIMLVLSVGRLIVGLWVMSLKSWARVLLVWLASLQLGLNALRVSLIFGVGPVPLMRVLFPLGFSGSVLKVPSFVGLIFNAVLLWFFTRPSVKAQFQRTGALCHCEERSDEAIS